MKKSPKDFFQMKQKQCAPLPPDSCCHGGSSLTDSIEGCICFTAMWVCHIEGCVKQRGVSNSEQVVTVLKSGFSRCAPGELMCFLCVTYTQLQFPQIICRTYTLLHWGKYFVTYRHFCIPKYKNLLYRSIAFCRIKRTYNQ